ncbi:MAG: precorrin-6y C5,15-methyltransferase (decarboxylating) subunit CbiE [Rhodospirillales bacterium]|jgi:precorrin-6B C5,15-methyltransferase / cobalt-precorrin-6B C5,C15-methyltransferase|nr:precorrin-6y C5,15-methyltransferase (decarboxylating) subunit CbiE [Rhodospirillales bacterium]
MTKPWITIIGIGEDGLDGLGKTASDALDAADVFFGGERHLAMLGKDKRPRLTWDSPLLKTITTIKKFQGKQVCVLASGDPMTYGIGVTLTREIGAEHCTIIAHQSAFSMACARLGWSLANVDTLTLHGRPLGLINQHLRPNAKLLILSADGDTPKQVAQMLKTGGYGASQMTVFEHMGGPKEKQHTGTAKTWRRKVKDLNTIALHCIADQSAPRLTKLAGLPDEVFQNDGMLTKHEVRAVTLAALSPAPGEVLWDVGAGAGSIAIEFLRAEPTARAIAIEQSSSRIDIIRNNADSLGVQNLHIVQGGAPDALKGLDKPTVIFIGGGVSNAKVLQSCWRALPTGGRLIANSVSMEGETQLYNFMLRHGGELSQISISKMGAMGDLHAWRAMRAVTQYKGVKS